MNPKLMVFVLVVVVLVGIAAYYMMQGGDDSPAGTAGEGPAPAAEEEEGDTENTNPKEAAGGEGDEKAPVPEKEAIVEKKVSDKEPQAKNPAKDIAGCTFHGTAESYDAKKRVWKDLSAAKNDVTRVEGEIEIDSDDSSNNQKFMFGSTDTFMEFPQAVMTTGRKYTLFHVAKYNGSTKGRIFAGTNHAFVSGFTNGYTGTAHRNGEGWIAHWDGQKSERFRIHTDQKHVLRRDGLRRAGGGFTSALIPSKLVINPRNSPSDWAIAEVIVYNKELSLAECKKVEAYLMRKYNVPRQVRAGVHMLNKNRQYQKGGSGWSFDKMAHSCGDEGVLYYNRMNRHKSGDTFKNVRNFDTACIQGLDGGVTQKQTSYVEKSNPWYKTFKKLGIDCGDKGISGVKYKESADKKRLRAEYACHNQALNAESCEVKTAKIRPLDSDNTGSSVGGDITQSLHNVPLNCGPNQAMTSMSLDGDNSELTMSYKCCNLADA